MIRRRGSRRALPLLLVGVLLVALPGLATAAPDRTPRTGARPAALPSGVDVGAVNRGAEPGEARSVRQAIRRRPNGRIIGLSMGREVVFEEHWSRPVARFPGFVGLRTRDESPIGRWVWTEYTTGEQELYDLSGGPCWSWQAGDPGDPCQLTNLAGDPAHAEIQAVLQQTLAARAHVPLRLRGLRR